MVIAATRRRYFVRDIANQAPPLSGPLGFSDLCERLGFLTEEEARAVLDLQPGGTTLLDTIEVRVELWDEGGAKPG